MSNLILHSDSYKSCHYLGYPPGMTYGHYYLESRGGEFGHTVFFGLQYYLKKFLSQRITTEDVTEAGLLLTAHGEPFNWKGWNRIVTVHGGRLPMKIRAVPEGSVIPTHNVLMTVESTDEELAWVPSYFETLLMRAWYPITVATTSFYVKKVVLPIGRH